MGIDRKSSDLIVSGKSVPGHEELSGVMHALREQAAAVEAAASPGVLAAMVAAVGEGAPEPTRSRRWARLIAAGGAAAVLATGGLASAGALPDPAQDAVAAVVERVGVTVPHGDDDQPESGAVVPAALDDAQPTTHSTEHGALVSAIAQEVFDTGREHGMAVSAVASDGRRPETPGAGATTAGEPELPAAAVERRPEDAGPPADPGSQGRRP